jgi:hypothetical protein
MKISLCTTCLGRLHHLKQTLPANLALAGDMPWKFGLEVELSVIAYGDAEAWEWLQQAVIGAEMQGLHGQLRAFYAPGPTHWHVSKAKNLAHVAATGDVLVNVDADNFVSADFIRACYSVFADGPGRYVGLTMDRKASPGRIALHRQDFYRLGGYSEATGGAWWGDDQDLMRRAAMADLYTALMPVDPFIQHGHVERLAMSDVPPEALGDESKALAELKRQHDAGELVMDQATRDGCGEANRDAPWAAELLIDTMGRPASFTQIPMRLVSMPRRLQTV